MRTVYKVLAYAVAVEVIVQATAMAFAIAGLLKWVDGGGLLDKAVLESDERTFPEVVGFIVHEVNGGVVIPAIALAPFICSFFAKVPGAVKWAGLVLLLVFVQMNLGYALRGIPALGALHGLNALLLFAAALHTARRARVTAASPATGANDRLTTPV
jgi:hypothetical protein